MSAIYKYKLDHYKNSIKMPKGAKILTVREQGNDICLWAEVEPDNDLEVRNFEVFATGQNIPYDMGVSHDYLGTAMLNGGYLVMHVYEYTGF